MLVPPEHRMPQWTDSQTGPLDIREARNGPPFFISFFFFFFVAKVRRNTKKISLSETSGESKVLKRNREMVRHRKTGTEPKLREGGLRETVKGTPEVTKV